MGLEQAIAGVSGRTRGLPPVHLWNPAHCGVIDIVIRRDGSWWHEGSPIGRLALVRLFSTVLRKDPEGYVLVTPAEKLSITVEDAPFLAVAMERTPEGIDFATNVGDLVQAGPESPIRVETGPSGAPRPYIHVRGGLEARIVRSVFYELAEMAQLRDGELWLESRGASFRLGPST